MLRHRPAQRRAARDVRQRHGPRRPRRHRGAAADAAASAGAGDVTARRIPDTSVSLRSTLDAVRADVVVVTGSSATERARNLDHVLADARVEVVIDGARDAVGLADAAPLAAGPPARRPRSSSRCPATCAAPWPRSLTLVRPAGARAVRVRRGAVGRALARRRRPARHAADRPRRSTVSSSSAAAGPRPTTGPTPATASPPPTRSCSHRGNGVAALADLPVLPLL